MATTADIKIGMCIELDGKTFQIVDFQHVKPGKGPAFVRTKLKNLENGRVLDNTFSAGVKIEPVRVERRPYQFTYEDDLGMHFMHTETFEEINIDKNLINNYDLMADGQIVEVMFHTEKEQVLSAELPPIVDMEVTYTEPGVKGDTLDQLAQARNGQYGRHDPRAAVHQHGRQDSRRYPHARVLRAHQVVAQPAAGASGSEAKHPGHAVVRGVFHFGMFTLFGPGAGYIPGVSNSSITRSILRRISAVQRLPMLPSWVWCTSRVGRYSPRCTAMPTCR